ncbi:hypothetical protein A5733_12110 [Mycobacterium sp. NS-7484]|uniref:hypothetical protein n=1 Tax=Mycobacterium sp. NS-7484 TaxID=1834161 RepID=UPI00096D1986|nr:hypothetical protein [Mycobacterium sp. NS-7484]OMB96164.1 hypothetical protein A5733_12110 [Mycobacterium sp. NS-7484]
MFPVEIWGNVAEWVGAIGTSGAAITAVGYYMFQHRTEKRKQAMLVAVEVSESRKRRPGEEEGRWLMELEITNNSASTIREVDAELVRKSFYDTIFRGAGTVIYELLPDVKQDWEDAQGITYLPLTGGRQTIEPGGKFEQVFDRHRMTNIYRLRVTFVDTNSFSWAIVVDNGGQGQRRNKLKEVRYYRGLWERRRENRRTPEQLIGGWRSNLKYAWWMIGHPAKKKREQH